MERPAPLARDDGPLFASASRRAGKREPSRRQRRAQAWLTVRMAPAGPTVTVRGREALTLTELMRAGARCLTSGEIAPLGWARRTSAYVRNLRAAGVRIDTAREPVGDAVVGRYRLAAPVVVLAASEGLA